MHIRKSDYTTGRHVDDKTVESQPVTDYSTKTHTVSFYLTGPMN